MGRTACVLGIFLVIFSQPLPAQYARPTRGAKSPLITHVAPQSPSSHQSTRTASDSAPSEEKGKGAGVGGRGASDTPPPRTAGTAKCKEAYVTLVTTPKYVIGAEVLAKSLRALHASRPLLALVDSSLPKNVASRLEQAGWRVKYISHVANTNRKQLEDRPWFNTTFSKLHVFGLTEYDKIVYLDADILLLANIDELFDKLPLPLPGSRDEAEELEVMERRPFAAASEVFPPDTFNSGVLVIRPRATVFSWLVEQSQLVASYDGSDQGFLNTVFSDWWQRGEQLGAGHRLAFKYNVPQTLSMYYPPAWNDMRDNSSLLSILHFAGDDSMKPWSYSGVVPASLARYVHAWQQIARAPLPPSPSSATDVANVYSTLAQEAAKRAAIYTIKHQHGAGSESESESEEVEATARLFASAAKLSSQ